MRKHIDTLHRSRPRGLGLVVLALSVLGLLLAEAPVAGATVKEIEAEATFHCGDNQDKSDGRQQALLLAKRNALEQAGTYVESSTEVKDFQLSRDEIRSYTGSIVEVVEVGEPRIELVGENLAVTVRVRARVDDAILLQTIAALRQNAEGARALREAGRRIEELEARIDQLNESIRPIPRSEVASLGRLKEARRVALTQIEKEERLSTALASASRGSYLLHAKDDPDGAIKELRAALRLQPDLVIAKEDLKAAELEREESTQNDITHLVVLVLRVITFPFRILNKGFAEVGLHETDESLYHDCHRCMLDFGPSDPSCQHMCRKVPSDQRATWAATLRNCQQGCKNHPEPSISFGRCSTCTCNCFSEGGRWPY